MKSADLRKFAPFSLGLGLLTLLFAGGWYIVRQQFDLTMQIGLGLAVIGLCASVLLDPERARRLLTGRQARYGSNALVLGLAFLGILIVINYLVYQNDRSWDLTEDRLNTLLPESVEVLESLPENVTAKAFVESAALPTYTEELLKLFARSSNGKFSYEIVNVLSDPVAAQDAQVTREGQVVVYMGQRHESISQNTEEGITTALVRLMSAGVKKLYFLTGHGERDLSSSSETGYSQLKQLLQNRNYQAQDLNLLTTAQVPGDADAVVVAGPQTALAAAELEALSNYLAGGGSMMIFIEPSLFSQLPVEEDLLAAYLQGQWGLVLKDNFLVDLVGQEALQQPLIAVGADYQAHSITNAVSTMNTLFPGARSVETGAAPAGVTLTSLVATSQDSWAETDVAGMLAGNATEPNSDVDMMGPVWLGAAAENTTTAARLVVLGDADFANNEFLGAYGNTNLLTGMTDWITGQEDLISLTPPSSTNRVLKLQPDLTTKGLILLISVFVLPGMALAGGIVVWVLRRRHV